MIFEGKWQEFRRYLARRRLVCGGVSPGLEFLRGYPDAQLRAIRRFAADLAAASVPA